MRDGISKGFYVLSQLRAPLPIYVYKSVQEFRSSLEYERKREEKAYVVLSRIIRLYLVD